MTLPLWITYSWADSAEGDFESLVQRLRRARIPTTYDKIALIPGRRLWEQIAEKITSDALAGWAFLVTPNSLSSEPCKEELGYALHRTLQAKGANFPLIGLLYRVSIDDVPAPVRVRLCVNLASQDWVEEIRGAVLGRPPRRQFEEQSPIAIRIHHPYLGDPSLTAVEFRPRFTEVGCWRI